MATKRPKPAAKLLAYRAKRDFKESPEPSGAAVKAKRSRGAAQKKAGGGKRKSDRPLRFCVQKHLASHLHYDFRLEHAGVLLSWAVPKGPSLRPSDKRLAIRVEDHPVDYGDFEGLIPSGYGTGVVMLWDRGTWRPEAGDVDAALEKGELKFSLDGVKLKGSWVLVRTREPESKGEVGTSKMWLLIKHRDQWAGDGEVTDFAPLSVKSFRGISEIAAASTSTKEHRDGPLPA
jgi:bifunctional non-homologous end joining protein LigD